MVIRECSLDASYIFAKVWHRNKAVAEGAVSFYIDHFVAARVSKLSYGTDVSVPYQPFNPEHLARSYNKYENLSGKTMISGLFDVILPKVLLELTMVEFILTENLFGTGNQSSGNR